MSSRDKIEWLTDVNDARRVSSDSGKPVLMFFHYEHCNGCKKTFDQTLPKMSVIDAITDSYVPLLIDIEVGKDVTSQYRIDWTPTFVVTGPDGGEADRWTGYLPEDDFLGMLNMAVARYSLRKGDYRNAERHFDEVAMKYALTDLAPEAHYYIGVARYRNTGDASWLTKAYTSLKDMYPDSIWTLKASAWASIGEARKAA